MGSKNPRRVLLIGPCPGNLFGEHYSVEGADRETALLKIPDRSCVPEFKVMDFARTVNVTLRMNGVECEILNKGPEYIPRVMWADWIEQIHKRTPLDAVVMLDTNSEYDLPDGEWGKRSGVCFVHGDYPIQHRFCERLWEEMQPFQISDVEYSNRPSTPYDRFMRDMIVFKMYIGYHTNKDDLHALRFARDQMATGFAKAMKRVLEEVVWNED